MKGYKVFDPDWTCRGKQYTCPGEFTQGGKLELCKNGIHFCKKLINCFNYYTFDPRNKVAEVEAVGDILTDDCKHKCCTNHIRVIRELSWHEVLDMVNMGNYNTGYKNTGNKNSGNWNSGNGNSGDWNSGNGNCGIGNCGSGNCGDNNGGDWNCGDCNSGDYNTGDWNTTNYSTGCFNTLKCTIDMFNMDSGMTYSEWIMSKARYILENSPAPLTWISQDNMTGEEKEQHPEHKTTGGYLRKRKAGEMQKWWDSLSKEDQETVMALPNFDPDIFKECTEIDVTAAWNRRAKNGKSE